jgi:hypothetical protein
MVAVDISISLDSRGFLENANIIQQMTLGVKINFQFRQPRAT